MGRLSPRLPLWWLLAWAALVLGLSGCKGIQAPTQPTVGAAGLNDSLYPNLGNGGYDAQHYLLDFTVNDVSGGALEAVTSIQAQATQELSSFNLDFVGFTLDQVSVNGEPAIFRRNGSELHITPATPLQANESFTVEVSYRGVAPEIESVALPVVTGWLTFDSGSYVLSEPDGAQKVFPANDHPLDKASYTLRVTVPKPYEVAANGLLSETIDHGDSTTFVWEEADPMASYLATVAISNFDVETMTTASGVLIRNYYGEGLDDSVGDAFDRQGEMLEFFGELFGPYPFEVYGALVMNTDVGAALETQTLSTFGVDQLNAWGEALTDQAIAHELAHQWFGDSVSVADWGDVWLNESFATYAEGLWVEHSEGSEAFEKWLNQQSGLLAKFHDGMAPPGEPPADDLFNGGVYVWGALALHALRVEVGDEEFFAILHTYAERFRHGNARTSDFIAVAEEVSGRELDAFFEKWLYGESPPLPVVK